MMHITHCKIPNYQKVFNSNLKEKVIHSSNSREDPVLKKLNRYVCEHFLKFVKKLHISNYIETKHNFLNERRFLYFRM